MTSNAADLRRGLHVMADSMVEPGHSLPCIPQFVAICRYKVPYQQINHSSPRDDILSEAHRRDTWPEETDSTGTLAMVLWLPWQTQARGICICQTQARGICVCQTQARGICVCQSALTRVCTFCTSIGDLWERTLEPGSFADLSHLEPPGSVLRADCLVDMVSDG